MRGVLRPLQRRPSVRGSDRADRRERDPCKMRGIRVGIAPSSVVWRDGSLPAAGLK
jgi:hypothetical protein